MSASTESPKALRAKVRAARRGEFAGRVVVEGARLIAEAIAQEARLDLLVVSPRLRTRPLPPAQVAAIEGFPGAVAVTDPEMERLSGGPSHQGTLALVRLPAWTPADCLRGAGWLVALDGVQDAANLGGIARAALAFGASGIWYREGGVRPENPRAYRAAAGAFLRLPIAPVQDLAGELSALSWPVYVAAARGAPVDGSWPPPGRAALVFGSEGQGSSVAIGQTVAIPMLEGTESLNVAQAAAILLWRAGVTLQAGKDFV